MNKQLYDIEISKIFILNPRERNKQIAGEIRKNIEDVGLKRPITITRKQFPQDGYEYDLVCGQGRLEAYIANNQKTIPAIVVEASEEDALIMSLVENIARKNYQPFELFKNVKKLHDYGYSAEEIANKTGLGKEYMRQIIKLLDRGEERLLNAVENNKIPLNVALQIVETPDSEIQRVLQEAYEQGIIKGNKLNQIQKIIEVRKRSGKNFRSGSRTHKPLSPADLNKIYEQEINRKMLLIRKADKVESTLIFLTESFRNLLNNQNFINLLKAENLEKVPQFISEKVNQDV
ncbi:MAG: plasmid partitioning protein RepB C-terminal domain-containing protein [Alphaproteobacteria bacterium]|jgi:ParB family transcriptional regulator, chromosome partitioning protein